MSEGFQNSQGHPTSTNDIWPFSSHITNDIKDNTAHFLAPFLFPEFLLKIMLLSLISFAWVGSCHTLHSWLAKMPFSQAGVKSVNGLLVIATAVYHQIDQSFSSPHTSPAPIFHICHKLAAHFGKDFSIYYIFISAPPCSFLPLQQLSIGSLCT